MSSQPAPRVNVLCIGAGLANGLLVAHLRQAHPQLKIRVLEAAAQIPGGRTWSFHEADVEHHSPLRPLVAYTWSSYEVSFPKRRRVFASAYHSITPDKLQSALSEWLGDDLVFNAPVREASENQVVLRDGRRFDADCVIDGSGLSTPVTNVGWQKFVGLRLKLNRPHGLTHPRLMDASVEQRDGFRFFYVLPFAPDELLVEDTRYSRSEHFDSKEYEQEIVNYVTAQGWSIRQILAAERGALPIPWTESLSAGSPVPRIGAAGGIFHPVTGYSLPDACRLSHRISQLQDIRTSTVTAEIEGYRRERASVQKFYLLLNRMMFLAAEPDQRYRTLEHFYRLSDSTVRRFYAGRTTWFDRARILSGRPPVPVWRAVRAALYRGAHP